MSSGPAGDAGLRAVLVEGEPELGGDDDLVADRLQGLADELLVVEGAVDLGGVEEGDAAVDRGAQERDHLVAWWSWAERLAHAHAAEAEGGDRQALGAEGACLHGGSPGEWSGGVVGNLRVADGEQRLDGAAFVQGRVRVGDLVGSAP